MPLHVRLVGGGLGTTLRISIWRDFFCGNVPVFIHVHVADGIGYTLEQVSGSGAQDNRRNVAVNVHVMKFYFCACFPMPLHVRLVGGWARHYFANLDLAG